MKPLAKIAATIASLALAASAFGCSSPQQSSDAAGPGFDPQNIEVNDSGYTITDEGKLRYAFVAVNPNEGHVAENVIFTVEAYDANGSMIAGGGETIPVLYPGLETAGAGEAELFARDTDTPEVASLSIVAMMDSVSWSDTDLASDEVEGKFSIRSPQASSGDDGTLHITASIGLNGEDGSTESSKPVEAYAVALLFDASGQAICGTSAVTFALGGDNGDYELNADIPNAPEYEGCTLYVTPAALL